MDYVCRRRLVTQLMALVGTILAAGACGGQDPERLECVGKPFRVALPNPVNGASWQLEGVAGIRVLTKWPPGKGAGQPGGGAPEVYELVADRPGRFVIKWTSF